MSKRNYGDIKSILHFDFPYYHEPNDGLGDEASSESWKIVGNTSLAGTQIPYAKNAAPKFGYRCAYFPDTSSYIIGTNKHGTFNISKSGNYEIEAFIKLASNKTGNIVNFDNTDIQVIWANFNGHTFAYFIENYQSWPNAKSFCEELGGHLVTITNAEKAVFIQNLVAENDDWVWLGAVYDEHVSTWKWITGEEWNYTNWDLDRELELKEEEGIDHNNPGYRIYASNTPLDTWAFEAKTANSIICEWDEEIDPINFPNLLLSVQSDGTLALSGICDEVTSSTPLTLNTWQHILLRFSQGYCTLYLDGVQVLGAEMSGNVLTSRIQLGGFVGYMDEFVFRASASSGTPKIPAAPYNATFDVGLVGGFGTGSDGDVTISANSQINSYGLINSITDTKTFTVNSWSNGTYTASEGTELMFHITAPISTTSTNYPDVGLYAFSKIASIDGTNIVLEDEITTENGFDFTLDSSLLNTYYVQVITVPHFNTLTVNSGKTISPLTWNTTTGGGIVAFRCKGDCTIRGNITTHGRGAVRYDYVQMENSKLIDRFLCAQGGGIFITCGGTFTTTENARLGATWSGEGNGSNGAAGKGGNSGYTSHVNYTTSASFGGVGGGGGGTACTIDQISSGGNVGNNASSSYFSAGGGGGCGGNGGSCTGGGYYVAGSGGGGQGNSGGKAGTGTTKGEKGTINGGKNSLNSSSYYAGGAGGGAPGGNGGSGYYWTSSNHQGGLSAGIAGACIILLCNILRVSSTSISTGGGAGQVYTDRYAQFAGHAGGGGTGFCYISEERLI